MYHQLRSTTDRDQAQCLWPGRIGIGEVCVIAGEPGVGKSLLALTIAAQASSGRPFPGTDQTCPPTAGFVLSIENNWVDTAIPWLKAAKADMTRIQEVPHGITVGGKKSNKQAFDLATDLPELGHQLESEPAPRLFIVDPVYDFLDALGRNKQRDINRILYPLSELAHQTQTTVLLLTHLQKFKSGRPVQLLGSIAFQRTADSVYLVERVSESGGQRRRLVPARIGWRVAGTSVDFFIRENSELKLPYIAWGAVEPHEPLNVAVDRRGRPPVIGAETERVLVERLRIEPANLDELHALVPDPKPSKRTLSRYIDAHHGWIKQPGGRARLAVLREPPQFQSD